MTGEKFTDWGAGASILRGMAKFEFALGTEIEVATGSEINKIVSDHVSPLEKLLKGAMDHNSSIARPLSASATSTASFATVPVILDLGAPPSGRAWDVRRVTLMSPDPLAAALTTPVICFATGQSIPNPIPAIAAGVAPFDMQSAIDVAQSVPAAFNYGGAALMLAQGEHYYIALMATASGQTFIANMRAVEIAQTKIREIRP